VVDPFRRGGFGSPSLTGPFQTGGGNFGQYMIGDDGSDIAYLDKLRAQTAWANGQLTDAAYLAALQKYVNSTEKGSSQRISAENELHDATWSIGRNKHVRAINRATTPGGRIRELLALARYDRKRLATMERGNEQYREQVDRIESTLAEVRATRWNRIYAKYEQGQLTNEQMLAAARRFAQETRGKADNETYKNLVRSFDDRLLSEHIADAQAAWGDDPTKANADAADALFADLVSRSKPGSPQYREATKARENFKENVESYNKQLELTRMQSKYDSGAISDRDWLDFLRTRMDGEQKGTPEYIRARDSFLQAGAAITQNAIVAGINDGSRTTGDLIEFLSGQLFFMDPNSAQAGALQVQIAELQAQGQAALSIAQGGSLTSGAYPAGGGGYGHMVYPADLAPGGTPVNAKGFASQFDGSAFASTNCNMASTAMLAWAVSGGEVKVSGGDMRYYSGDREGGTNVGNGATALSAVGIEGRAFHGDLTYQGFRQRLLNGKPAVLSGISGATAKELQLGYTGPHSVYVDRAKVVNGVTWYYVMDPLGRGGYKGQWWDEGNLRAYGFDNGQIEGFALFAGKGGNAKTKLGNEPPPRQAFDTDWEGKGTQGRGGGASRAEAGPARDWSKGKSVTPPRGTQLTGSDPEAVAAFLAAVTRVESRTRAEGDTEGVQLPADDLSAASAREQRAIELLDANGGDPRLAAVEWFTGTRPVADVSSWTQTERWYANLVAKPMGLEKVKRGDIIAPGAPPSPIVDQSMAPDAGNDAMRRRLEAANVKKARTTGLNPTTEQLARDILSRLGIAPREQAVQMVSAWIIAENGNGEVDGFNPLNLQTQSVTQLPGQIGKLADGTANFDSYEAGLDATADVLEASGGGILAALRSNDPEAFAQSLMDAKWSPAPDYGNLVTQAYNTLPNATRVISNTMPNHLTQKAGLAEATVGTPDLSELLDVDSHDPNQMAWFTENVDRAEAAAKGGQSSWVYEAPDGTRYQVASDAGVVSDVLYLNFEYEVTRALSSPKGAEDITKAKQRLDASRGEIDFRSTQRYVEAAMKQRDAAVLRGEWGNAWEIEKHVYRQVNTLLGNAADADADINNHNNEWLKADAAASNWTRDIIDRVEPKSTDPNRMDIHNPKGSEIGQMVRDGLLIPQRDPKGGPDHLIPNPDEMFVTYDAEGAVVVHNKVTDPDEFAPVKVWIPGPDGQGDTTTLPAYQAPQSGWVPITFSNGMQAYVKPAPVETSLFDYYNREYEEPSKTIERTYNPLSSVWAPGQAAQNLVTPMEAVREQAPGDYNLLQLVAGSLFGGLMGQGPMTPSTQPGVAYNGSQIFNQTPRSLAPDPEDALLVRAGEHVPGSTGHPPIQTFTVPDPTTGQMLTGWSIDGVEWMFQIGDGYGSPPALVAKSSSKGKFARQADGTYVFTVNGKPAGDDIDWSEHLVFYGDDREPGTRAPSDLDGVGGKGARMVIKPGVPSQDGRPSPIDASFSPLQLYRAGAISPAELKVMSLSQRKLTEQWLNEGGQAEINAAYEAASTVQQQLADSASSGNWVATALGIAPHEQVTGPNAMQGYADPNVTNGVAANAASSQIFLAEEDAARAAAEAARKAAIDAHQLAKTAAANAPTERNIGAYADETGRSPEPTPQPGPAPVKVQPVQTQQPVTKPKEYTYGTRVVNGTTVDTVSGGGISGSR
jgi:hypothetical protein